MTSNRGRLVTYTKTKGYKMAYNQYTHDEIEDIDDLVDDANKEILKREIEIRDLRLLISESISFLQKLEDVVHPHSIMEVHTFTEKLKLNKTIERED